jgi:Glycosyl hydrolases family 15
LRIAQSVESTVGAASSAETAPPNNGPRRSTAGPVGPTLSLPRAGQHVSRVSFWLVDNYILQGRYAGARKLFDCLLARCNDVGLLAEELDPQTGRMLGNFPQAYSHVGLINCALNLSRQTGPAEERAEPQASARDAASVLAGA